jgi:serine-type D-Ala-D-Ala carboxypeptidase/endopeptidase (penicillin-binding protein 4)
VLVAASAPASAALPPVEAAPVDSRSLVVDAEKPLLQPRRGRRMVPWMTLDGAPLPEVLREMNKWSNNVVARHLMLSWSPGFPGKPAQLDAARERFEAWLQAQGLAKGDIELHNGSGLAVVERGTPRALTTLLAAAWQRGAASQTFVDSLPRAGEDGTMANRLRDLPRGTWAWLKTGSLSQVRGLAGYVQARSGRVYAVALLINHPNAARGEFALDSLVRHLIDKG